MIVRARNYKLSSCDLSSRHPDTSFASHHDSDCLTNQKMLVPFPIAISLAKLEVQYCHIDDIFLQMKPILIKSFNFLITYIPFGLHFSTGITKHLLICALPYEGALWRHS